MRYFRKALACILALALLCPAAGFGAAETKGVPMQTALVDTDGSDGYAGDYVVIYNPETDASASMYTGSLEGLTEGAAAAPASGEAEMDIDAALLEAYRAENGNERSLFEGCRGETDEHSVGDTLVFRLNDYSPAGNEVEFKVVAVGEYCYVWTPSGSEEGLYPLDAIDPSYPGLVAQKFDASYPLLAEYVGEYNPGVKINIMYYNIEDGWTSGGAYIGGFFSPADCYANHLPMLSLDTYPGVYHPLEGGGWDSRLGRSFGITVHEYQHMINYLRIDNMEGWLNETMSAAVEELCYPGSSLVQRIPGWVNNNIVGNGQQYDPPAEYNYTPGFAVHEGGSLYSWGSGADIGARMGRAVLFAQYLYTHYGNGFISSVLGSYNECGSDIAVLTHATGVDAGELVRRFYVALTANDPSGLYSFAMQQSYDPAEYYGVENLYDWLAPVIYTGAGLDIEGGGAVTIKPVGGVYYPPEDAADGLVCAGVTVINGIKGDIDLDGDVDAIDALMALRYSLDLVSLSPVQLRLGDVNDNGAVNANDALAILRYTMGLTPGF